MELRQPPHESKEHTVPADLITSTVAFGSAYLRGRDRITMSCGLTSNEFTLIRCFVDQEEWTATELTDVLPADASRISRLVDGLVSRGLLRRRRRTDDRRVVRLLLTDAGSSAVREVVDWGGWGLRWGRDGGRSARACSVPFIRSGVAVDATDGRRYYVSSASPDDLAAAIDRLAGRARPA